MEIEFGPDQIRKIMDLDGQAARVELPDGTIIEGFLRVEQDPSRELTVQFVSGAPE